ncbi:MAG: hypothetical protein M1830_008682 [Pleopsidium flavum]|nr:MAG: hypothetical protein M1830_008682 [Pleopsidium flavum]
MARRRTKKRTHVGARNGPTNGATSNASSSKTPKSMVIRIGAGEVGPSVSQLVRDVRSMMEPGTASRLKERKSNKLKDYITMAGPLGVSHLLLFSKSTSGNTNLRLALTPRGPTLHFQVEKYSLCKDVKKAIRHPKGGGKEYLSAPLLVMNNFASPPPADGAKPSIPKHLESLTTTVFQSLFPPISPQATPLASIRRVLLLNREPTSETENGPYTLNLRHYAITTKRTGISRGIRRLNAAEKMLRSNERGKKKALPNLSKMEDVADYLLDPSAAGGGFTSGSESEIETDAEVEVLESNARKVMNKKQLEHARNDAGRASNRKSGTGIEKRAVKLVELGPRMKLRMTKVEEGVCTGKVMWHEFLTKSRGEVKEMDKIWEQRRIEKEARRKEQRENIERKRKERGQGKPEINRGDVEEEDMDMEDDEWDSEGLEGDAEMEVNREAEAEGNFDEQQEEIATG